MDTVGATILQETVAAVNGGTDATDLASSKDENNTVFLIIFRR